MTNDREIRTILYLSSSSGPGGAERVQNCLAASLDRKQFKSIVCLFRAGWLQDQCANDGIETHVLPTKGMLDWKWACKFLELVRREHVALIHAHEFDANTQGSLVACLAGIPLVATVHGKNYYWDNLRRRFAYRQVSRYATMVAVSEDLKNFIVNKVGVAPNRIKVIYNGVGTMPLMDQSEIRRYKLELGLEDAERVVGTVGSLYPVKGHKYLLEAIPAVLKACPRAVLLIVGRGELEVSLKDEVRRLGVERKVHFLGLQRDIPKLLALMDVFVLPSLSEGLSMAVLEAMVASKPVVATHVGGNPELVVHGETGLLVPPQDSAALASNILLILTDKDRARRFGESGKRRVEQHFGLNHMVDSYQNLYDNCLRG